MDPKTQQFEASDVNVVHAPYTACSARSGIEQRATQQVQPRYEQGFCGAPVFVQRQRLRLSIEAVTCSWPLDTGQLLTPVESWPQTPDLTLSPGYTTDCEARRGQTGLQTGCEFAARRGGLAVLLPAS